MVAHDDQVAAGGRRQVDLEDVARRRALLDEVLELQPLLVLVGVEDEADIDAALVGGVGMGDVVIAVQRLQRADKLRKHRPVLNLAQAENVRTGAIVQGQDDFRQLLHLLGKHRRRPVRQFLRQLRLQPVRSLG